MIGAIEIYNKPRFEYRDEVFVILLLNAWELLLKAMLSKAGRSIYYRKRRGEPYRTLGWRDALNRAVASKAWPASIPHQAIDANLTQLAIYRDSAVHFYNAEGFGIVIYGLAQTSITNFRDVLRDALAEDLTDEITWHLLPLGIDRPVDPIAYLRGNRPAGGGSAVDEFLVELARASEELEREGIDTGRLMTVYGVKLESVKRIERADVVVGVSGSGDGSEPVYVERRVDPTKSHPLRQNGILEEIGSLHHKTFTSYDFQAIVHQYGLREKPHLCWRDDEVNLVRWSRDILTFIRGLSELEVQQARSALGAYRRTKAKVAA
jgi:hypothetical protein